MDAAQRRQEIVLAAVPLFAARGLNGVTTRELASAARVSEALLYRHFGSKDELFDACKSMCLDRSARDAGWLNALPDSTATLVLAVYLMMRNTAAVGSSEEDTQRAHFKRLLLRSLASDGAFARSFTAGVSAPWIDKLGRCWRAAVASGDLDASAGQPELTFWFAHHLAAARGFFNVPEQPTVELPGTKSEAFVAMVRFSLRGLGVRPEAIESHLDPQAFEEALADKLARAAVDGGPVTPGG